MTAITSILTCFIVLLLPGIAIRVWVRGEPRGFAASLADCIGLSISITAVLFLITFYTPLRITPAILAAFYILCSISCLAGILYRRLRFHWSGEIPVTLILLGIVLALRFYQVQSLVLPAWVDSIHHTLITKVIIEQGAIPVTLEPYLNVPFSYYFGFHALAAVFSQVSGLPAEKAILFLGQVLNACVPLAIYRLGIALWGNRIKSLLPALLVAFISQMPAYYVTWGRYTLLTGMLLLALSMANLIELTQPGIKLSKTAVLSVSILGLTLSHYFSALLFLLFCACYLAPSLFQRDHPASARILKISAAVMLTFLLLVPWLYRAYRLIGYGLDTTLSIPATSDNWQAVRNYGVYLWKLAGPLRNQIFLLTGVVGIIPAWIDKRTRGLAIWTIVILICALPFGIDLPNIRADHMVIVLFFPLCLCAACLLDTGWRFLSSRVSTGSGLKACAALILAGVMSWGAIDTRTILNPATVFVTKADLSAIEWIHENVQPNARFLINSVHWQSNMYRGNDGGYWLLPLTGNFTFPPPVIVAWGDRGTLAEINETAKRMASLSTCDAEFQNIVKSNGISHIYLREGRGSLEAKNLLGCAGLERIYFVNGVSIFRVSGDLR